MKWVSAKLRFTYESRSKEVHVHQKAPTIGRRKLWNESRVLTPGRSVAEALERKRQTLDPNSAAEYRGIIPSASGGITFGEVVVRLTNFSSLPRLIDPNEVITYKGHQSGRVIKI